MLLTHIKTPEFCLRPFIKKALRVPSPAAVTFRPAAPPPSGAMHVVFTPLMLLLVLTVGICGGCVNASALTVQGLERARETTQRQKAKVLKVGVPVRHDIASDQLQLYSVSLDGHRSVRVIVKANLELAIAIIKPSGEREDYSVSPAQKTAAGLTIPIIGAPGVYRFEVRALGVSNKGHYELTVEEFDITPTYGDRTLHPRRDEEVKARRLKKQVRAEISEIETRILEEEAKPLGDRSSQIGDLSSLSLYEKYNALRDPAEEDAKSYVRLSGTHRTVLARVQQSLPSDTTLLAYYFNTEHPVAFLINNRTIIKKEIPPSYKEVSSTVEDFLGFSSTSEVPSQTLEQWYTWFISPLEVDLEAGNLGIIGDGAMQYVPFAALTKNRKNFLSEKFNLFYLPRLEMFTILGGKHGKGAKRMLVVAPGGISGLSYLKNSKKEVESIDKLYKIKPLTGANATRVNFIASLDNYQIVHVIAHAKCNKQVPKLSHIIMTPDANKDGSLSVDDVVELKLKNIDLIVLSACETKVCGEYRSDEIGTLNDAFIAAGASTVIASLWAVDDHATSLFMSFFYKHLKHMSKAAALAAAQTDVRSQYPHPYYWAGFVLTGDPGPASTVNPTGR